MITEIKQFKKLNESITDNINIKVTNVDVLVDLMKGDINDTPYDEVIVKSHKVSMNVSDFSTILPNLFKTVSVDVDESKIYTEWKEIDYNPRMLNSTLLELTFFTNKDYIPYTNIRDIKENEYYKITINIHFDATIKKQASYSDIFALVKRLK